MRAPTVLAALALASVAVSSPAAGQRPQRSFYLVGLPSMGIVTWRCHPTNDRDHGLGFRAFRSSATDDLRLISGGKTIRSARVDPGKAVRFPLLPNQVQRLQIRQMTEPGTLRARVTVSFDPAGAPTPYCIDYEPPRIDVRVDPRR